MFSYAKLSLPLVLLVVFWATLLPSVSAQHKAVKTTTATEDPEKLADERRVLYNDLCKSRKDGILKDDEIAKLKERNQELEGQEKVIQTLRRQLKAAKDLQLKYKQDAQTYKGLTEQMSMKVATLEDLLKIAEEEKERQMENVQRLIGANVNLQARINELEKEKADLEQRVLSLEKTLEEFDFFTAIRVHEFKCVGYDKNGLNFSFKLVSDRKPTHDYTRDTEVLIEVLRKFKIGVPDKPTESCTGRYQRMTIPTGVEKSVRFCSKEPIERDNPHTGTVNEYRVNIKIIYRKHEIWVSKNEILDLSDCK